MLVSVFTPSHDTRHLSEAYRSLSEQTFEDWEWIVLLNKKATDWSPPAEDPRVKVSRASPKLKGIGALKRAACELATGEILVELDHDDLLSRGCLAQIVEEFDDPAVVFAYSDFAQVNADGSPNYERFDTSFGWVYTRGTIDGQEYERCHALAATPHNMGHIWYAPNHVRAFRRSAYEKVGGYDASLEYLDDQDLMIRLYLEGPFRQIQRCLYFQRIHTDNTQRDQRINAAIQVETLVKYREWIERLALAWSKRHGLRCLQLKTPIWLGDDPEDHYEVLVVDPDDPKLPVEDSSVGLITGYDVLQRLPKRAEFFNEIHRATVHGGLLLTQTPSTDGRGAFQDPSHTAFYNENSFMYLTQADLQPLLVGLKARFQVSHLNTYFASELHEQMNIPYVLANLLTIKDGPRQGGPLLC